MDSLLHGWRSPSSGLGLTLMLLALALVAAFVVMEYVFDWPIHVRNDRAPTPAPAR
ncbi:hypothetical protein [Muricoccus radiodurans]|uniref:hypothetical protein n=1 Tax=Muricoccus radiodurans TaxID=2231721 RepID=UPI003CF8BA73